MNIITIDADKAAEEIQSRMENVNISGDVTLKYIKVILQGCTVPMPESAKDVVKKIRQVWKRYNVAAEEIRQIWKSFRSDCKPVYDYDTDYAAVRDNEIATLIQAYVEERVAEKCKECADYRPIGDIVVDEMTQGNIADLKAQNEDLEKYRAILRGIIDLVENHAGKEDS